MVESDIEQKIKTMNEGEKNTLLKDLLVAALKVKDISDSRKAVMGELKKTSERVISDVVKVMEDQIVRAESEKEELKVQIKKLQDNTAQYEQKIAKVTRESDEKLRAFNEVLEKTEMVAAQALKEKSEVQEKLKRLQDSWESFVSGT
ncbi:MAG: hypothetical protein HQL05_05395 [Nitrospirae bacterium]|uniref:Magnetosome protein Man4 n=2 Tax=Nitrospirota TaxID=40117 RepID=A0A142BU21_9BACT|nr:hypothetical protein [Candidatus Magnetobacterium casensis]AIM41313.1 putative magnetosome protein Man4 [Candidatus Magnetobacterium casensis]AMP41609.1 magnetosome protein Man4 [uncultured Nitrospirota bacterium]MBF0337247.1 hypothetical protein [Nitrospirota bacterium]